MTTSLTFQETQFNVTNHAGKIWLRGTEIAKALGMSKADAVTQIYHRNADEFTDAMTLTLNLSVNGINNSIRSKKFRLFSLRGAHLIAMFARTAVAKEFRRWVLDILDKEVAKAPSPPKECIVTAEVIYSENGIPAYRRPLHPNEIIITKESNLQMLACAGYVVVNHDRLMCMGLDEVVSLCNGVRREHERWLRGG